MDYYGDYGTTSPSTYDAAAFAIIFGFLGIIILFVMIICVIGIIGKWKMFKKANQPEWAAIVPIYNTYILCKITGVNPWWILIVYVSSMFGVIPVLGPLVSMAISIYFSVLLAVSIARSYGKDDVWAIGLVLLQPFFLLALGFGKSEYVGAKPMDDVVMNKIQGQQKSNTNNNSENENNDKKSKDKYCTYCGKKIQSSDKFCQSCGKEINN